MLNRFTTNEWSTGDRDVPSSQRPAVDAASCVGRRPGPSPGASTTTTSRSTDYFKSTWLPTPVADHPDRRAAATGATTGHPWTSSPATTTWTPPSSTCTFTSVELDLDADELGPGRVLGRTVSDEFTDLPSDLDEVVASSPSRSPRRAVSRFEKAVALQNWFREDGGFELRRQPATRGNGADDLVAFLRRGTGGRAGYCEQFAAAMAVMARIARHPGPGRGRLPRAGRRSGPTPTSTAPTTCTPGRSSTSTAPAGCASSRPPAAAPTRCPTTPPSRSTCRRQPHGQPHRGGHRQPRAGPRLRVGRGRRRRVRRVGRRVRVPVAAAAPGPRRGRAGRALLLTPRAVRRRRRRLAWPAVPRQRGPSCGPRRSTSAWPGRASAPRDRPPTCWCAGSARRPTSSPRSGRARGPDVNPDAVEALDRIVLALELPRYAEREPGAAGPGADVQTCVEALNGGSTRAPAAGRRGGRGRCSAGSAWSAGPQRDARTHSGLRTPASSITWVEFRPALSSRFQRRDGATARRRGSVSSATCVALPAPRRRYGNGGLRRRCSTADSAVSCCAASC